jgi:hypothetical protein
VKLDENCNRSPSTFSTKSLDHTTMAAMPLVA